jgi:ABC-2 type transport system ATP-binding protein
MPTSQPSIIVEGLSKSYGDFKALDDITFQIQPGEIVGFLGPNGAGKTTTMKILTCFMAATSGSAKVAGLDVYSQSKEVRKKIGYLPESVPLYEDMFVYDYLEFMAELRGVPKSNRKAAIKRAADLTGLTSMVSREIHELSKGYRQRVGLAQAIIHEPDVVILDEPTSGLDPNQILEIRDLIKEIGREKTVIFSTHILQEVSAVCDRIIVINRGKIVADGTFEELSTHVAKGRRGVIVHLTAEGHEDALEKLEHVSEVIRLDMPEFGYRLATEMEESVRRSLIKWAAENNEDILELRLYKPDLEETFRFLTGGEEEADSDPVEPGTIEGEEAEDVDETPEEGEESKTEKAEVEE